MSAAVSLILDQALKLSPSEQLDVVDKILTSLDIPNAYEALRSKAEQRL